MILTLIGLGDLVPPALGLRSFLGDGDLRAAICLPAKEAASALISLRTEALTALFILLSLAGLADLSKALVLEAT